MMLADRRRRLRNADATISQGVRRMKAEAAPSEGLALALGAFGASAQRPLRRLPWSRRIRRLTLPAGATTAVLALSAFGYVRWLDITPHVIYPRTTLPASNAFDLYVEAGSKIVNARNISTIVAGAPPVLPPPFTVYCPTQDKMYAMCPWLKPTDHGTAAALSGRPTDDRAFLPIKGLIGTPNGHFGTSLEFKDAKGWLFHGYEIQQSHHVPLADQEKLISDNRPVLQLLRRGLTREYQQPGVLTGQKRTADREAFLQLGDLLEVQMKLQAFHEDWAGAMATGLDGIQFGTQLPAGGNISGRFNADQIEAMCRKSLRQVVPHLTADQAKAAARRLEAIVAHHVPFSETVMQEKWSGVQEMLDTFRSPGWRGAFCRLPFPLSDHTYASDGITRENLSQAVTLLRFSKQQILDSYMARLDDAYRRSLEPFNPTAPEWTEPEDAVNRLFEFSFVTCRFNDMARCLLQDRFLLVTLALHAYRQEHGAYPTNLNALAPRYLSAIPRDPFAENHPLLYRRLSRPAEFLDTRFDYLLYSVGPDGRDNGGKPMRQPDRRDSWVGAFQMAPTLEGDILAGVNS
jgi:hypothetical protein